MERLVTSLFLEEDLQLALVLSECSPTTLKIKSNISHLSPLPTPTFPLFLQVLEALEVCTQCEVEGDVEFEFPCLNFIETLSGLWQKDDERYSDAVYGGVRLHTSFQSGAQLKYLFPRIQVT